ncbi:hypothetical protein KP509_11G099100 [Ceratopteris richardii]|uniref:Protein kinase domain-containing protein n=1 Tax=Ceratopteris richardii TaxID=49495 RepID=A0A8T2TVR8_CERRI|nr:hypothetical protein KP509_11G099100 [Ceratopteris richardii]
MTLPGFHLCILFLSWVLAGCVDADNSAALLEFLKGVKPTSGGCVAATWTHVHSEGASCPSSFCGVSCMGGVVVALDLSGQSLEGTIPSKSIALLHSLTFLNLSRNSLSGELPDDLGDLSNLKALDLSHNLFTGVIPVSLGRLRSLLHLNISSNYLNGSIPGELASLAILQSLDLHDNGLTGALDPALLGLTSLNTIDLSNNKLSGFIPWKPNDTLPLLKVVESVNLSHNELSGPLAPAKLTSIFAEKLKVLDVSYNQLFGNLPDFEFVIALVSLRLNNNYFTGAVPPTLLSTALGLLEELDLSHNKLTGEVPRVLSTSLKIVNLSYNSLSGMLPKKLGSCYVVDLNHNNITGDLSMWQYWSDMLEVLDISANKLTGELGDGVSRFVRLRVLNISHNGFSASIPSAYGFLPKLSVIDVSFNNLDGAIPASLFNSSTLSTLVLSNNLLVGDLILPKSPPLGSQKGEYQMAIIDISNNKLNGTLSEEIENFQKLRKLDLSNNSLSGNIPNELSNLTMLQLLDLSSNLLLGSIPGNLPKSLNVLRLANNNLSGQIPKTLEKFPNSSFFPGNMGLFRLQQHSSGQPAISELSSPQHTSFGIAVKAGIISGCLAGFTVLAILGILVCHRFVFRQRDSRNSISRKFDSDDRMKDDAHGHKMWSPCAAYCSRSDQHVSNPPSEKNFSNDLLLENKPKYGISRSTMLEVVNQCKPEDAAEIAATGGRQKMSPTQSEPQLVEELFASPVVLKVQSPDKLAGDLHFLDKSLHFTAEELSRAPAEVLGRSSHGTSYKATLDNGHILTVKWLREGLAKNKREFAREANKFAKIKHPNLIPFRAYYWGPKEHEKLLLSDFESAGNLVAGHLNDGRGQHCLSLQWQQRLTIAVDIARGLTYLHDNRHLPHGNLKATNVLINRATFNARLADYGLHKLMTDEGTANQVLNAGALGYRAPELATMKKPMPSFKGDIYAFGVLMLELLTGQGAGDIISGQSGVVDLTDWVKTLANEGRALDCLDSALVSAHGIRETQPGVNKMLILALRCISQQPNERPVIHYVYEQLTEMKV